MAVKVQQVLEILEQIAPPELACSWDNVGLLVDAGRPVTSIMTILPPMWCAMPPKAGVS